ncbi:DUF6402 family protein [Xenorhabdus bovienii]|uniref:Uncharacterized protein n=6 Tax=Xenorhabdus TaxID=626 RepID=D3V9D0_XENNA|nr:MULTISPECIES: DUF6402 family protein [Xenorhabdus]MDE9455776.1 DUF6402 family protein [Xenorhabdus bovienii]MDE9556662.1 DUF6402 family protein [Xenorhabdus bovienii]CBJ81788.1 conserved hypothetical protein [Xenorhabdus bovienii SS-2004]CBJ91480.1 conserved hypothetical protein [Xenorhabdus nematophila ATCC 19061]CEK24300.1 conserved hypothetical protein [Xenorhabdus nematophila AN6/1]
MSILKTKTVKGGEKTDIEMDIFYLNQIPDAMEKMGWEMAPKLMRHWFNTKPAYTFTEEVKTKYVRDKAIDIPDERINASIIKMEWALKYKQPQDVMSVLINGWSSSAGIDQLKIQLKKEGGKKELGYEKDMREIDTFSVVNSRRFGSKFDTIDDWYGAMGNSNMKVAVKGYVDKLNGKDVFVTEQIGMYLKDTYDFVGANEPLGIWSKNGILDKISSVDYAALYATGSWMALWVKYNGYVPVINDSFRKWQKKYNEGGDFIVYSDVLWMNPLSQHKIINL